MPAFVGVVTGVQTSRGQAIVPIPTVRLSPSAMYLAGSLEADGSKEGDAEGVEARFEEGRHQPALAPPLGNMTWQLMAPFGADTAGPSRPHVPLIPVGTELLPVAYVCTIQGQLCPGWEEADEVTAPTTPPGSALFCLSRQPINVTLKPTAAKSNKINIRTIRPHEKQYSTFFVEFNVEIYCFSEFGRIFSLLHRPARLSPKRLESSIP
jgi:hypothetical protein